MSFVWNTLSDDNNAIFSHFDHFVYSISSSAFVGTRTMWNKAEYIHNNDAEFCSSESNYNVCLKGFQPICIESKRKFRIICCCVTNLLPIQFSYENSLAWAGAHIELKSHGTMR